MLKKDVKNAKSFSVILDEKDALELREMCDATGMSANTVIKYAVKRSLPAMRVYVEAMRGEGLCPSECQEEV